jgi:hypothetical protein
MWPDFAAADFSRMCVAPAEDLSQTVLNRKGTKLITQTYYSKLYSPELELQESPAMST